MLSTIIFAFHGAGKSYLASHDQRFVDLDLASFACLGYHLKELYDDMILDVINRGFIPLVNSPSCLELLSKLKGVRVLIILPKEGSIIPLKRMVDRGQCPNPLLVFKTLREIEDEAKKYNLTVIHSDETLYDLVKGGLLA